jgi:hypothetical protein
MTTIQAAKELEKEFSDLVTAWTDDTLYLSSIQQIVSHPAYQKIISLGPPVLPLIFRDLPNRQSLWFWALHQISGADPVADDQVGDAAVSAWLAWGRARGYVV